MAVGVSVAVPSSINCFTATSATSIGTPTSSDMALAFSMLPVSSTPARSTFRSNRTNTARVSQLQEIHVKESRVYTRT